MKRPHIGGNLIETTKDCKNVSSHGFFYSSDVRPVNSPSGVEDIDFSKGSNGCTLYIRSNLIKGLSDKLETIPYRFILITGDCDESVPDSVFTDAEFNVFINSEKIIHWFSQNCVGKHPKISAIPIGLDYGTRVSSDHMNTIMSPLEQDKEVLDLRSRSEPFHKRKPMCYSNFHLNKDKKRFSSDRDDAISKIPADCIYYEPKQTKRLQGLQRQTEYAFVVSPHGNGLDCHRTWEALCVGCIPIVKTSPIDVLYDRLPVLIVKDWSDINASFLKDQLEKFSKMHFDYDRITLKYWMDTIHSKKHKGGGNRRTRKMRSGGGAKKVFHFYSKYHYGDNIFNLKFFYNITDKLKENNIEIHYYYDKSYVKNKSELDLYVKDATIVQLKCLGDKPPDAIELWMGYDIDGVNHAKNYELYYNKFYEKILKDIGLDNKNIDTSIYQKCDYLTGIYSNITNRFPNKYDNIDILIINAAPQSQQIRYDKNRFDALCVDLSKKYKIATTTLVNDSIACTHSDKLSLQDIGAISTHAKYIIAVYSGPIVPCFNSITKNAVKKWFILLDPPPDFTEISVINITKMDQIDKIPSQLEM